ncbi:MAG TPA: TetR/AcrR family transcriptional regulator [Thermoleophilaceae bacterium]|nr:TetR/AcrR family transcriptional regulator [Thermoleophilaceae bacterium]
MKKRAKPDAALLERILASPSGPGDHTSDRILNAAVAQAEEFGVRRFTIGDVAQRVGLSRVTVYKYFPGKDRLIEAVLLHEMRRFLREIDTVVAPYDTLEDRLVEGFVFALTWLRKHRLLNRLLKTEPELIVPHLTVRAGPVLEAGREFIAGFARREAKEGGLPLDDADIDGISELLARAVLSFVLTPDSVLGLRTQADIRTFAEHYLAPTLQAIAGSSSRPVSA